VKLVDLNGCEEVNPKTHPCKDRKDGPPVDVGGVRGPVNPKTQVQKPNLGHPPRPLRL